MTNGLSLSQINLIDIFGYLIPGTVLLAGIILPINVNILFPDLPSIAGISLIGVFAFVVSISVSHVIPTWRIIGLSNRVSPRYDHRFSRDLFRAQEQAPKNFAEDAYTTHDYFDYQVWELCRDRFSLPDNLSQDKFDELWYGVLSYLETTPHTRAFRMQALYTFSKNMVGVSITLSIFYTILVLDQLLGLTSNASSFFIATYSISFIIFLLVIGLIYTIVFASLSSIFLSKWHQYSKLEFFIDQKMKS